MRILLSNDDGVFAPGINVLRKVIQREIPDADVIICAPGQERSTTGHGLSIHDPLWLQEIDQSTYSCSGLPADSSYIGISHVMQNDPPDFVISGINHGGNMGQDIYYSGTMAAAREAVFRNIPAMAISLCTEIGDEKTQHFESAGLVAVDLIKNNAQKLLPKNWVLNVNVPNLPYQKIKGMMQTRLGHRNYTDDHEMRTCPRGRPYFWNKSLFQGQELNEGTDCFAVEKGFTSLTALNLIPKCSDMDSTIDEFINSLNC